AVEIYGVDADLSAPLSDSLSLRAALSWLPQAEYEDFPDASGNSPQYIPFPPNPMACIGLGCGGLMPVVFDASGDRLIRAPKLTSSLTLAYEAPLGEGILDASATLFYSSEVLLRSEEHTSELQSRENLVCRLLLEKKNEPHADSAEPQA